MWGSVIGVLHGIYLDGGDAEERGLASGYMFYTESFEYVIILHLMLRVTNDLSHALQAKDQNIVSAMRTIVSVKSLCRN